MRSSDQKAVQVPIRPRMMADGAIFLLTDMMMIGLELEWWKLSVGCASCAWTTVLLLFLCSVATLSMSRPVDRVACSLVVIVIVGVPSCELAEQLSWKESWFAVRRCLGDRCCLEQMAIMKLQAGTSRTTEVSHSPTERRNSVLKILCNQHFHMKISWMRVSKR